MDQKDCFLSNLAHSASNETKDSVQISSDLSENSNISCDVVPNALKLDVPLRKAEYTMPWNGILIEHCYARPHNWRPESMFLRPTKTLFVPYASKKGYQSSCNIEIDIESVHPDPPTIYDLPKATKLMNECERHVSYIKDNQDDNWDEKIIRTNWSAAQNHVFNVMVNILNSDRLSRLAYTGVHNEVILRRTVIDKSVRRMRQLMAKYFWDINLVQWMHKLLIENLSASYLAAYFDILQTLKSKLPTFVEKMLSVGCAPGVRVGSSCVGNEGLQGLLKRPWDPIGHCLTQDKPKKLPANPIILLIPGVPLVPTSPHPKRFQKWANLFANLATVVTVQNSISTSGNKLTLPHCADQQLALTRAKMHECRNSAAASSDSSPAAGGGGGGGGGPCPIVLVGVGGAGSALALQAAYAESSVNGATTPFQQQPLCVVCLGFGARTAEGERAEPDDNLLEMQVPVLFVVGQCADTATQECVEDIRERMRVESGLLIVGGADSHLRVSTKKRRAEGVTQSVVDRCVVDEVGEFVSGLLLSPYPPQMRYTAGTPSVMMGGGGGPTTAPMNAGGSIASMSAARKRYSSGCEGDGEPPSPTPRITRPVGRPPGSKSKNKIEQRWHALQQARLHAIGISTPSSLPSSSPRSLFPPFVVHGAGGVRTLPPNPSGKQIKILDSMTIAPQSSGVGKILTLAPGALAPGAMPPSGPLRPLDMSKAGACALLHLRGALAAGGVGQTTAHFRGTPTKGGNATSVTAAATANSTTSSSITTITTTTTSNISSTHTNTMKKSIAKSSLTKYITSKRQLLCNSARFDKSTAPTFTAPSSSATRTTFMTSSSSPKKGFGGPPLASPANLTSQDIMDLPIIFADDNQMLANNNTMQPSDLMTTTTASTSSRSSSCSSSSGSVVSTSVPSTSLGGGATIITAKLPKMVFLNKQPLLQQQQLITTSATGVKRPPTGSTTPKGGNSGGGPSPIKYAKIILSKAPAHVTTVAGQIAKTTIGVTYGITDAATKSVVPEPNVPMDIDLEKELVASTITKPSYFTPLSSTSISSSSLLGQPQDLSTTSSTTPTTTITTQQQQHKNITLIYKKATTPPVHDLPTPEHSYRKPASVVHQLQVVRQRQPQEDEEAYEDYDDDPDYVPNKTDI